MGDRGYDADRFRWALADRGIQPCTPSRNGRTLPVAHHPALHHQRHRIENMFARLTDRRRIATRHNRRADLSLSARTPTTVALFRL